MDFIQNDPWGNDARVAIAGFKRIVAAFVAAFVPFRPGISPSALPQYDPALNANIATTLTILSARMAVHRTNQEVQQHGVEVIYAFSDWSGPFQKFISVAQFPDVLDSLVTAMLSFEHDANIQYAATSALCILLAPGHVSAARFVQAPQGKGQGLHAVFRALENHPTDKVVVCSGFLILVSIDRSAPGQLVEYTNAHDAHDRWREILGNTDVALRPDVDTTILGTRIMDF